ncbi:unnamed protein product [Owenia fusiformis]|uniref:Uncharacterized protein n=1 Tax=Owenia fusiformis TaxID=6347 RepID=A0A8J1TDV9_OWEFU|nr:unnamed protein product [Owenia fusiformis]
MINDKIYKAVCELNGHSGSPPNLTSNKVDYYEITVPVNGGPGTWSAWGACSTTCGDGDQTRIRACDNPFPAYCGSQCNSSDLTDMRSCNESKCPDKPGPPGLPFVFVLDDIANVTWTPPHDDGGAIITNYNIEMRRSDNYNNTWVRVNMNICIPGNSYLMRSLTEDVEYEFRIVAENEAGTGEPSQQSVKFTFVRPNVVMRIPSPIWSPIWDLTVTSLGNIVTTSTQHSTSKIYNRTFQLIKDLNKKFICVTKTSDGQLAFTTNPFSNIIHFYTENGSPIRTITCPSDIRLNGIASLSAGELVVTDGYTTGVYIVDSSNGNTTQISTSDDMFQSPTYLAVDIRNHIIVSDYHRHLIKVINREGLEIIHYGSGEGQLMGPLGVCTDINGFIILGELGNRWVTLVASCSLSTTETKSCIKKADISAAAAVTTTITQTIIITTIIGTKM